MSVTLKIINKGRRAHSVSPSASSGSDDDDDEQTVEPRKVKEEQHSDSDNEEDSSEAASEPAIQKESQRSTYLTSSDEDEDPDVAKAREIRQKIMRKSRQVKAATSRVEEEESEGEDHFEVQYEEETRSNLPHTFIDDKIYSEFSGTAVISAKELRDDDVECWIIQCPRNFPAQSFLNKKIKLSENSKLKIKLPNGSSKKLEVLCDKTQQEDIACIVKDRKKTRAVNLPIQGKLTITEFVEGANETSYDSLAHPKEKISLPEGLKLRHPLLGIEFDERVDKGRVASKKLRKQAKRKMKEEPQEEETFDIPPTSKRKRRREEESTQYEESVRTSLGKRKRRRDEESQMETEELDTTNQRREPEESHKRKRKREEESQSQHEQDDSLAAVPRKKKRHDLEETQEEAIELIQNIKEEPGTQKERRRKSKHVDV